MSLHEPAVLAADLGTPLCPPVALLGRYRGTIDLDHGPRHATQRPRCGPRVNDLSVPDVTARTLAIRARRAHYSGTTAVYRMLRLHEPAVLIITLGEDPGAACNPTSPQTRHMSPPSSLPEDSTVTAQHYLTVIRIKPAVRIT